MAYNLVLTYNLILITFLTSSINFSHCFDNDSQILQSPRPDEQLYTLDAGKIIQPNADCNVLYPRVNLQTPNFPNPYPENLDICWIIVGDETRVSFLQFDLRDWIDFLEFRDGPGSTSPLMGNFSASAPVNNFFTPTSSFLYVRFKTAPGVVSTTGFNIRFYSRTSLTTYNTSPLSISGGKYDGMVVEQTFLVEPSANLPIHLVFQRWTILHPNDVLEFRDGLNETSPLLLRLNGGDETWTKSVTTTRNQLYVRYKPNDQWIYPGGSNNYQLSCESSLVLTSMSGTFQSPNWPANYPARTYFQWIFVPPPNHWVYYKFTKFDLGPPSSAAIDVYYNHSTIEYTHRWTTNNNPPSTEVYVEANLRFALRAYDGGGAFQGTYAYVPVSLTSTSTPSTTSTSTTRTSTSSIRTTTAGATGIESIRGILIIGFSATIYLVRVQRHCNQ